MRAPSVVRMTAVARGLAHALTLLLALVASTPALAESPPVYPDAESVEPLPVGATIPSVEVRTIDGAGVDLAKRVGEQGALLVFYRGGW